MVTWMIPIAGAVIGYLVGGFLASLGGLAAGYVITLLIGRLLVERQRKRRWGETRRRLAAEFLRVFGAQAKVAFPDLDDPGRFRAIEEAIDTLFEQALADQPGNTASDSLELTARAISRRALGPDRTEFWFYLGVVAGKAMGSATHESLRSFRGG